MLQSSSFSAGGQVEAEHGRCHKESGSGCCHQPWHFGLFQSRIVQAGPDVVQQAYTCSVKTHRRITMVKGGLKLAERVDLFLKYNRHSHMMHADDFRGSAPADPLDEVLKCIERNG